jgi:hypothetical protein
LFSSLESVPSNLVQSSPNGHGHRDLYARAGQKSELDYFPRAAELRAFAGFTPCYHIGRESSCYTFRQEYKLEG